MSTHAPSCRATIGASKTMSSSVEWLGKRTCEGDGDTEGVPTLDGVAVPGVLGALGLPGVEIGRRYRNFNALVARGEH